MNTNDFIADLLQADWCLNGTSVEAGFDCVTLMNEVFSRLGIAIVLPLPGQYRFAVCETEALKKFFQQLEPCAPFPGSMVSMNKGGHGGVVVFDAVHGVEPQSDKYRTGLPDDLPAWVRPLPFVYQSTGGETRFTNGLDPEPRSRGVFAFHRPETLVEWARVGSVVVPTRVAAEPGARYLALGTTLTRLQSMPPLDPTGLWPVQVRAIQNLERSMAEGRARALVQMATGSGKTRVACALVYRLIKHAGVQRVLFLVDRNNLGRQARQ